MTRIARTTTLLAAATAALALSVATASAAPPEPKPLNGTFKIAKGKFSGGKASGSYFRMQQPGAGQFLPNPSSTAADKTYTPVSPGSDGGLISGKYQRSPSPGFDRNGNSLAAAIIKPVPFNGPRFGVATLAKDPQSGRSAPAPRFSVQGRKLTAWLPALTATWNTQLFNQGAPKPGAGKPTATGTYEAKTRAFTLSWKSPISGGPFDGFTGVWHLEGEFTPAPTKRGGA